MEEIYIASEGVYTFEMTPKHPTFEISYIGFDYTVYKQLLAEDVDEPLAYAMANREIVFTRPMSMFNSYSSITDHNELKEYLSTDGLGFESKRNLYAWYEGGFIMAAPDIPENTDWKWRFPVGSEKDCKIIWKSLPTDVPTE